MNSGYVVSLIAVFFAVSIASLAAYKPSDKTMRLGLGIILAAAVIFPIKDIGEVILPHDKSFQEVDGKIYSDYVKEAFENGIGEGISKEFGISKTSFSVEALNFYCDKAKAERIRVTMGAGSFKVDHGALKKYVNGLGVGECEVILDLG